VESDKLCACGNGIRQAFCCDAVYAPVPEERLPPLNALVRQANMAFARGAHEEGAALCIRVLEQAPFHTDALSTLYNIRCVTGPNTGLLKLLERIASVDPNHYWSTHQRGILALAARDVPLAEHHARNAIRLAPQRADAHALMALIFASKNDPVNSVVHSRRAGQFENREDAVAMANLALNLRHVGEFEEGRKLFARSHELDPERVQILINWASLEIDAKRPDAAEALLPRILALIGEGNEVRLLRAQIAEARGDYALTLETLAPLVAEANANDADAEYVLWQGRLLDRLHRYEEAWQAFDKSKERSRRIEQRLYDEAGAQQMSARLRNFFTAARLPTLPRASVRADVPQPIFILGFPRSGTTLLEQSLSMHSAIAAGDELQLMDFVTSRAPALLQSPLTYPEALADLWMADRAAEIEGLRDLYLRNVASRVIMPEGTKWFTDKTPLNEMHMGLIGLMFPKAPLLQLRRHPLDVLLSVYSNYLTHGYNCAFTIESIARQIVLVDELVTHYRGNVAPNYLEVRYEDLVDDQEGTLKKVCAFFGGAFEPAMLSFHHNTRVARTASIKQVREKLYARSRYRYRNYLKQLAPVIPILAPTIERLGYTIA
jgi:tetratricopeptide (TPR) repeat protein